MFSILYFDGSHVVNFAAKWTANHGDIPMAYRNSMLSNYSWCKRYAARGVFVVSDLSGYSLSIGSYQVRRLVV